MFKRLLQPIFLTLSTFPVFAQADRSCDLKLSQAPTIRGLRLGMSVAGASEVLGGPLKTTEITTQVSFVRSGQEFVDQPGQPTNSQMSEYSRNIRILKLGDFKANLSGIPATGQVWQDLAFLELKFLYDRLESIHVSYRFNGFKWDGLDEFRLDLSRKTGLPQNGWSESADDYYSSLACRDFEVRISGSNNGDSMQIDLVDKQAKQTLKSLAKEKWLETIAVENEKKKAFKP